jgi:hypothetical protein
VAGSEAPLPVTVNATDVAGNQAQAHASLQIDDAPPQIGSLILVTPGVAGEDGKTWFLGDIGAPDVEVAVPFTDNGSGILSVAIDLVRNDLFGSYSGSLHFAGTIQADGAHFPNIPASAVHGKEGHLRFTVTTTDQVQNSVTFGPNDPRTMIWVDALPPTVAAPHVVYSSATQQPPPCGSGVTFCGRQAGTHLLADDTATVTFDAYDCGVGLQPSTATLTAGTTAGGLKPPIGANEAGAATAGACSNGNPAHHFQLTLNLATLGAVLDPPFDGSGTTLLQLLGDAQDRLQHDGKSAANGGTSGDGLALISLWRWQNQVAGAVATFAGAPALIPGNGGSRKIAVATTGSSGANVFVLQADGSTAWTASTGQALGADVAVGPSGRLYAVSPASASNGYLQIVVPPSSGSTGAAETCTVNNINFGTPPVIVVESGTERAIAASSGHSASGIGNVFTFTENGGSCASAPDFVATGDYAGGISANAPAVFVANSLGFNAENRNGSAFDATTLAPYVTATAPLQSPPAIAPVASAIDPKVRAFFGTTDHKVRAAVPATGATTCAPAVNCWVDDPGFAAQSIANPIPATPVFDGSFIYAADDHGVLYAIAYPGPAGSSWSVDFRAAALLGLPLAPSATLSPPIVVANETALVVRSDGAVALASSATAVSPLVKVSSGTPLSPVVDAHGSGGVAYVADGQGTLWAVQIPLPPLAAGQSAWPRPGRDSCNSRNAVSSCP